MIDENGVYTELTQTDALALILSDADAAGIVVTAGSVEEQIAAYLAQSLVRFDTLLRKAHQLQFFPTGSNIDLQNPNTPRLAAAVSTGYLRLENTTPSAINVNINTIFTAANGVQVTTGTNSVIVPALGVRNIGVWSVETGAKTNLPANQSFTGVSGLTVTNPQPLLGGRDAESDAAYYRRLIYLRTNYSSQQATASAVRELIESYKYARLYVNNTSNTTPNPLIIPANGYVAVVRFPSAQNADYYEIKNALQIIANRLEFGNTNTANTAQHPLLSGVIYTGYYPATFYVRPAQAVETTITAHVRVSFSDLIDESEKNVLARAFAKLFFQNLLDYFGGAAGDCNLTFDPLSGPAVNETIAVEARESQLRDFIAPEVSIEQIRALIADVSTLVEMRDIAYRSLVALDCVLDPLLAGEPAVTLDIAGPRFSVDFARESLFTDNSGWWDRYIYLDPALLTITVEEV